MEDKEFVKHYGMSKEDAVKAMASGDPDVIQHFGVKGMKWGKRKGSVSARFEGAQRDRVASQQNQLKRNMAGKGTKFEKVLTAPDRVLMGKKAQQKMWNRRLNDLNDKEKRIDAGELTLLDKLDRYMGTSVLELGISVRDERNV